MSAQSSLRSRQFRHACYEFEQRMQTGEKPQIESFLPSLTEEERPALLRELIAIEVELRLDQGDTPLASEYTLRFPQQSRFIQQLFGETIEMAVDFQQSLTDRAPSLASGKDDESTFLTAEKLGNTTWLPSHPTDEQFTNQGVIRHYPPNQTLPSNTTFGDYELLREVARGGMGIVYQARQKSLDRVVALKMILSGQFAGGDDVKRFYAEAQAAANLDHPRIVPIYEIGEHAGQHFYSMGFINGHSLAEPLRHGPLTPSLAAKYAQQIAEAIAYAHAQGVIHRDIKPANVLIDSAGQIRVTDFGLAKRIDTDSDLTGTSQVLGTPAYMSPEQARGNAADVNQLADVYSLGALLYCLLAARPPFQAATTLDTLLQVLHNEPIPLRKIDPSIPRDLETICERCLQKEPRQRYQSAQAIADDLNRWQQHQPIQARPISAVEKGWMWCKREPLVASLIVAMIGFLLIGSSLLWERLNASRAAGLVDALTTADAIQVPEIIDALQTVNWWAEPLLTSAWQDIESDDHLKRRVGTALLSSQPDTLQPSEIRPALLELMLATEDPREFLLLRDQLTPFMSGHTIPLWERVASSSSPSERFRILISLAAFDPESTRWPQHAAVCVAELLASNSLHIGLWSDAISPIRHQLVTPLSRAARAEVDHERGRVAATLLTRFAADRPDVLIELALSASPAQFKIAWPALPAASLTIPALERELARQAPPQADDDALDQLATRQVNAAVTLFRLGLTTPAWSLLSDTSNPRHRTYLIHRFASFEAEPDGLYQRFTTEQDLGVRQAILLALGEYDPQQIASNLRGQVINLAAAAIVTGRSPGIHSAGRWLLQRWEQLEPLQQALGTLANQTEKNTIQNGYQLAAANQCYAIIPAGTSFLVTEFAYPDDAPPSKTERYETLPHSLAVATDKVTLAQFRRFLADTAKFDEQMEYPFETAQAGDAQHPATQVTWVQAARYCRWLSEQAGIPPEQMCFPEITEIKEGIDLPPDYRQRSGYRLPTQQEWECYCRAGTTTRFPFGSDVAMLREYSWHAENSGRNLYPTGSLKPNNWGLFDPLGQCHEWCIDTIFFSPEVRERIFRSTARFDDGAEAAVASPGVSANRATYRGNECGFRIVRTLPGLSI
ncbi:bifunctional serine/threonine-protein kinase/formylglycine-generating enzyme family protein [Planctomycetaceae bacterium SH139]